MGGGWGASCIESDAGKVRPFGRGEVPQHPKGFPPQYRPPSQRLFRHQSSSKLPSKLFWILLFISVARLFRKLFTLFLWSFHCWLLNLFPTFSFFRKLLMLLQSLLRLFRKSAIFPLLSPHHLFQYSLRFAIA